MKLAFESSPGSARNGSGGTFHVTVERLEGGLAALVCQAYELPELVIVDGNSPPDRRLAVGSRAWTATRNLATHRRPDDSIAAQNGERFWTWGEARRSATRGVADEPRSA